MAAPTTEVDASAPVLAKIISLADKGFTGAVEVSAKVDGRARQVTTWLKDGKILAVTSPQYDPPALKWTELAYGGPVPAGDGEIELIAYQQPNSPVSAEMIDEARRDWAYGLLSSALTWNKPSFKVRKRASINSGKFAPSPWQRLVTDMSSRVAAYEKAWVNVSQALVSRNIPAISAEQGAPQLVAVLDGSQCFSKQVPLDTLAHDRGMTRASLIIELAQQLAMGYQPTFTRDTTTRDGVLVPEALEDAERGFARKVSGPAVTAMESAASEASPAFELTDETSPAPAEAMPVFLEMEDARAPQWTSVSGEPAPTPAPSADAEALIPAFNAAEFADAPQAMPFGYESGAPAAGLAAYIASERDALNDQNGLPAFAPHPDLVSNPAVESAGVASEPSLAKFDAAVTGDPLPTMEQLAGSYAPVGQLDIESFVPEPAPAFEPFVPEPAPTFEPFVPEPAPTFEPFVPEPAPAFEPYTPEPTPVLAPHVPQAPLTYAAPAQEAYTASPQAQGVLTAWAEQVAEIIDEATQRSIMERVRASASAEVNSLIQKQANASETVARSSQALASAREALGAEAEALARAREEHARYVSAAEEARSAHEAKRAQFEEIRASKTAAEREVEFEEQALNELLAHLAQAQVRAEAAKAAVVAITAQVETVDTELATTTEPALNAAARRAEEFAEARVSPVQASVAQREAACSEAELQHVNAVAEFDETTERVARAERLVTTLGLTAF